MKWNFCLAHPTWTFIKSSTSWKSTDKNVIMTTWNLLQKRKGCNREVLKKKKSNTKLDYSMRVRQSQLLMSALKNSKRKSEKVLIMYAVYAIECCMRNQLKTS